MKRKIQKRVSENKFLLGFIDFKKILFFLKKNFILAIFILCIGLVGLIAFYKIFLSKPTYVYVKVRVGQGLWWASTQRPGTWFIHAIKNTKAQLDLTGKPIAEVLDVYYYPYWGGNQYDVYVTLRLKVTKVGATGVYNYNRETIGVSAPIDLEFSNTQFSGTIITLTET
ncbi:MAG: hypothetical protein NTZ55_04365, partial [Candidatus Roizmanbacteria bacterium]|nr:hypothetical protein [Candidatus Roizmanbacteria bacterium]